MNDKQLSLKQLEALRYAFRERYGELLVSLRPKHMPSETQDDSARQNYGESMTAQEPATVKPKRMRMPLHRALAFLVEDWREKERTGDATTSIRKVFDFVYEDGQASTGYHSSLSPDQVAALVMMDLEEVDSLEFAKRKARRFTTRRGLLRSTDLRDFLMEL